jgi:tetratricopeptide (TPR) repeat protein
MAHEKRRAESTLNVAVGVLDEIMSNVSERGVPRTLRLDLEEGETQISDVAITDADAQLLNSLLQFYDRFAAENAADLGEQTARALSRIGDIEIRLGHLDEAADAFSKAISRYEGLRRANPQNEELLLAHASALNQFGVVKAASGDVPTAIESHRAARELLEAATESASRQARFAEAETLMLLGTVGWRAGAREMLAGIAGGGMSPTMGPPRLPPGGAGDRPPPPGPPFDRRPPDGLPRNAARRGPPPQGSPLVPILADLNAASRILHALNSEDPQNPDYRLALARCELYRREFTQLGPQFVNGQGDPSSAQEAETILRSLVDDHRNSPRYLFELAEALAARARFQNELAESDRSGHLLEAAELAQQLTRAYPRVSAYQALEARVQHDLAVLLRKQGDFSQACVHFAAARAIQERLARENPSSSFYQVAWAQMLMEWSDWQRSAGDEAGARASLEQALKVAESSAPSWGRDWIFGMFLERLRGRVREAP